MSTALQALERMLLSRERREEAKINRSLQMMQLAQSASFQKSQLELQQDKQNISIMGQNLDLLQKTNNQMKLTAAQNFLQESGLSAIYSKYKTDDGKGLKDAVDYLSKKEGFFREGLKKPMDRKIAEDLITSTWAAFEQENPNAIINIGSKLYNLGDKDAKIGANSYEKKLIEGLTNMGALTKGGDNSSMANIFKTMRTSIDNEIKLASEIAGFVKGNYEITEDFNLIDERLKKLDFGTTPPPLPSPDNKDTILPPDAIIKTIEDKREGFLSEKDEIVGALKTLEDLERNAEFYRLNNIPIPENDLLALQNKENVESQLEQDLNRIDNNLLQLSNQIIKAKTIQNFGFEGYIRTQDEGGIAKSKEQKYPGATGISPGFGF